jgi:hypothetical protein
LCRSAAAMTIDRMAKAAWSKDVARSEPVRLSEAAVEVIDRARRLTRRELVRLDLAERAGSELRLIAWDLLRDQLDRAGLREERFLARNEAWAAVAASVEALDLQSTPDDGYWRVAGRVGAGAARAARFAACVLVAPDRVEPEVAAMLLAPWLKLRQPGVIA